MLRSDLPDYSYAYEAVLKVLYILDITQYLFHDKLSSISQSINGKSKDLPKLLKYFND